MNKRIETVLNNKEAKASDYFELVNVFCQSTIFLQNGDKRTVVSMEVNEFRGVKGGFEFSQKCSDTSFTIDEKRIKSVSGKMQEGTDMFFLTVEMVDDTTLYICIFHTDTNVKTEVYRNYKETDVLYLKEYFNDKKYTPKNLLIKDMFGFTTEFDAIDKISLIEEEEDSKYTIQILNKGVKVEFPLVEDSCNDIYIKKSGFGDMILIRPYGQPFMEIIIFVVKNTEM